DRWAGGARGAGAAVRERGGPHHLLPPAGHGGGAGEPGLLGGRVERGGGAHRRTVDARATGRPPVFTPLLSAEQVSTHFCPQGGCQPMSALTTGDSPALPAIRVSAPTGSVQDGGRSGLKPREGAEVG